MDVCFPEMCKKSAGRDLAREGVCSDSALQFLQISGRLYAVELFPGKRKPLLDVECSGW